MIENFKKSMIVEFDMSNLDMMHYFLGLEVNQYVDGVFVSQKKYVEDVLDRFQMKNRNTVSTSMEKGLKLVKEPEGRKVDNTLYKQIVGSLMYLTTTRLDVTHVIHGESKKMHLQAAKRILRYLNGTSDLGILYQMRAAGDLVGYTYSDYAGNLEDRKSTSGYVFMLSSGVISWSSKKQPIVFLSTTEAEYVAATSLY
uniref:Reverse transcriptase Ty1/copia-type domain-containing protein n=1 Tax=Solanum lycopersicum TaxID=4081 RepID=A0A3Q7IZ01_SOLLC